MNQRIISRFFRKGFISFIWTISILFLTTNLLAGSITIVADEWMPYNGEPNSLEPGYGIEIAKLIFAEAGMDVTYEILPWNRAIAKTRQAEYNAIIGAAIGDAPDFVFPEEEFGIAENAFFVKKGNPWQYKGLESLEKVQIGLIKDYSYGEELDNYFAEERKNAQYAYGEDPLLTNIKKLIGERIDVVIENENVMSLKAKEMGVLDQIQIIKTQQTDEDNRIFIAFSPANEKSAEYAKIFSEGIKKLRKSGELAKILAKYGLKDWK